MSGHHDHRAHDHHPSGRRDRLVIRPLPRLRSRRAFLGDLGGGALALAVLTPVAIAACSDGESGDGSDAAPSTTDEPGEATTSTTAGGESGDGEESATTDSVAEQPAGLRWARATYRLNKKRLGRI